MSVHVLDPKDAPLARAFEARLRAGEMTGGVTPPAYFRWVEDALDRWDGMVSVVDVVPCHVLPIRWVSEDEVREKYGQP